MSDMEYNKLMTHTITLRKRQRDYAGDFTDIDTNSIQGFVQYGTSLKVNKDNEEITATAIVFLKNDCGIDVSHPYWMVDQTSPYTREDMEVLKIDPIDDPRTGNTHHYELAVR